MSTSTQKPAWRFSTSIDGQYAYLKREGQPGEVHIKAESEGLVVDVWNEGVTEVVDTMAIPYEDLGQSETGRGCQTREENAADLARDHDRQLISSQDATLTAEQLDDKYNPDGGGEHPLHSRGDWREAVDQLDTISGYWDWVAHQLSIEHHHG